MKPLHIRDLPVLFFKNECNKIDLEKTVLDWQQNMKKSII